MFVVFLRFGENKNKAPEFMEARINDDPARADERLGFLLGS
jgi:hypothetical protein